MNWYLFAAYAVIWTLLFLFLVFLQRKQTRLGHDIERLAHGRSSAPQGDPDDAS